MVNKKLFLTLLLGIFFISFTSAISIQNLYPVTSPFVTNQSTVNISYGINAPDGLSSTTFSFNGINTTLWSENLYLFWNFDNRTELGESNLKIRDLSKWERNGTLIINGSDINASYVSLGKYNGAYNFTNASGFTITSGQYLKSNLSICAWINPNSLGNASQGRIVDNGYVTFRMNTDNKLAFTSDGGTTSIGSGYMGITMGVWQFVCVTRDSDTINLTRFYVNSVLSGIPATSGPRVDGPNTMTIGNRNSTKAGFDGLMDNLMIFNETLSQDKIIEIYNSSITKYNSTYLEINRTKSVFTYLQPFFQCSANSTGTNFCSVTSNVRSVNNININFSTSKGIINNYFYGVVGKDWFGGTRTIGSYNNFTLNLLEDTAYHKETFSNSGMNYIVIDMDLQNYYTNSTDGNVNMSANMSKKIDSMKWAYDNNYKVLFKGGGTPEYLANKTSGCNTTAIYQNNTCSPSNYTKYEEIVLDFINRVTVNGLYASNVEITAWGEPNSAGAFLSNLSESTSGSERSRQYNLIYNSTYNVIKAKYPEIAIGGPGIFTASQGTGTSQEIIVDGFLGNFSNKMDFFDHHLYNQDVNKDNSIFFTSSYAWILADCVIASANCSRIVISEWSYKNYTVQNSSSLNNMFSSEIGLMYIGGLNTIPSNLTLEYYQWSEIYKYSNTANYPEYPYLFSIVSEPHLDNVLYSPYNVTKNFAHLCPSSTTGSPTTVYVSSNDDNTIKQVSCKKGNQYSLIIINTDTNAKNVTLNMTLENGTSGYSSYLMDSSNGNMYSDLNLQLGILDSYGISYLSTPSFSVSEVTNLTTKKAITDEEYTSSDLYFSVTNTTIKHLASTLKVTISGNVTLEVDCNSVGKIKYKSDSGNKQTWNRGEYTCSGNEVVLSVNVIDPSTSSNEFEIDYTCSNMARTGYSLIMLFSALAILAFIVFMTWNNYQNNELDVGKIIIIVIGIVVSTALWLASGQNLGNHCGVIS